MKKYVKYKEKKNLKEALGIFKDSNKINIIDTSEKEVNENANYSNSNNSKCLHHRKRTSSYFLGTYLPINNILEEENNLNNNNQIENSKDIKENIELNSSKELNNNIIYNFIENGNSNNNDFNMSFPSYDENNINNDSVIIKQSIDSSSKKKDNNNENKNISNIGNNNIILEIAKSCQNTGKSFITFKNSLKFIKDKDERTTQSYLLALETGKKDEKNNYIASSNVIEEEKSSMLESKSEYSTKKDIIFIDKNKIENINNEINNNKEGKKDTNDKNLMSLALNEIINKNYLREENRRKTLIENKKNLLNKFLVMSRTWHMKDEIKHNENIRQDRNTDKNINTVKENELIAQKCDDKKNNNLEEYYFNSLRTYNNNLNLTSQGRFSIISQPNYIRNENTKKDKNNNDFKKALYRIPRLGSFRRKGVTNDLELNIMETPLTKAITTNSNNNSSSRNNSLGRNNIKNMTNIRRIDNLNNALLFIRQKKINNGNNNCENKQKYINKTNGFSTTSILTNSNSNTNTQSHSHSREKKKVDLKIYRKKNSLSVNSRKHSHLSNIEKNNVIESNKNNVLNCLKNKIMFNKLYEKIDVLEKVNAINGQNSFFLILCEFQLNIFYFSGLFKYYKEKERFIKIYGDERNPNYIFLKDIMGKLKYKIYEDIKNINPTKCGFNLCNSFKFTNNASIIIKS